MQKFFQEQVITSAPVTVIAKSHKGEELLVLNSDLQVMKEDELQHVAQQAREADRVQVEASHSTVKDLTNNIADEGSAEDWVSDSRENKPLQDRKDSHQSEDASNEQKGGQLSDETREMLENLSKWELPQLTKRF